MRGRLGFDPAWRHDVAGGGRPVTRVVMRMARDGKTWQAVAVRRCPKRRIRVPRAQRAFRRAASMRSFAVCMAKAGRLRTAGAPARARRHNRRADETMKILRRPIATARRTLRAMDFPETEMIRTIRRNRRSTARAAHCRQTARRARIIDDVGKNRVETLRRSTIRCPPDAVVARNSRHTGQGLCVRTAPLRRQQAPMRRKRRALHEKHRKRRKPDVAHPIARVAARTLVGQRAH